MNPGYVIGGVGGGLLLLAAASAVRRARFRRWAARATAVVVRFEHTGSGTDARNDTPHPVLRFPDAAGTAREVTYEETMNLPIPGYLLWQGQEVPVLYDPAKPTRVLIDTPLRRWLLPVVLGAIGTAVAAAGAVALARPDLVH